MNGAIWILVYLTAAGMPAVSDPMTLESCGALLSRQEFKEAFCMNRDLPKLRVYLRR